MAKIIEITVSVKRLIALAKYENVTYCIDATATVAANETAEQVYQETLAFCKEKIIAEMERIGK